MAQVLHYTFDDFQEPTENEFYANWSSLLNGNYGGDGTIQSGATDPFGGTTYDVYRKEGKLRFGVTDGTDIGTLYYGNTYTFSIYLRKVSGQTEPTDMEFDICDRHDSTNLSLSELSYSWKRFWVTAYHDNNSNYHFLDVGHYNTTEVFEWCCPQIEKKDHMTPFTSTSRTGTINDSSGNSNHATLSLTTTPKWTINSKLGNGAYEFNGVDQRIVVPNSSSLQVSGDLTISFWLYVKSLVPRTTLINKAYGGEFTINLETSNTLNIYRGTAGTSASPYASLNSSTISIGSWFHACAVASGTTITWYINGSEDTSATAAEFVGSTSTSDIIIGEGYTSGYFDGFIDDIRIYNTALSLSEIQALANAGFTWSNTVNASDELQPDPIQEVKDNTDYLQGYLGACFNEKATYNTSRYDSERISNYSTQRDGYLGARYGTYYSVLDTSRYNTKYTTRYTTIYSGKYDNYNGSRYDLNRYDDRWGWGSCSIRYDNKYNTRYSSRHGTYNSTRHTSQYSNHQGSLSTQTNCSGHYSSNKGSEYTSRHNNLHSVRFTTVCSTVDLNN